MLGFTLGIISRIVSNSYISVLQKILTSSGERASCVNFYTYMGLTIIGLVFFKVNVLVYTSEIIFYLFIMGILGALGNYFIIKALSCGELSVLAPINSYKPIVALIFGMFFLAEYPSMIELIGILLIIAGTIYLPNTNFMKSKALTYRFVALVFSGLEAIFIKKVIILTDVSSTFVFWALFGLIFSFLITVKNRPHIAKHNIMYEFLLIITVGIMQYSTNYVFTKTDVACALALFQLSTLLSIFLGQRIFNERNIMQKLLAACIMITGAVLIIFY